MTKYEEDFIEKLQEVFESTDISLNKLSKEYGVGKATIIKWSKDYNWSKKTTDQSTKYPTDQKEKKRSEEKKLHIKNKFGLKSKNFYDKYNKTLDLAEDLTEKERLFCHYYIKDFNATLATKKAGYESKTPDILGYQIKKRPHIKKYISKILEEMTEEIKIDTRRILSMYHKMAFYDINDYVDFGSEKVKYTDKNGKEKVVNRNFVNLKNDVDGQIVTEVSMGKDGVKIKMSDRQKALDKLFEFIEITKKYDMERLMIEKNKNSIIEEIEQVVIIDDTDKN